MKKIQMLMAIGLFVAAGLVIAGCSDQKSGTTGGTTPAGSGSGEMKKEMETPENASTNSSTGEFQMVSLSVPNMT